MHHDRSGHLLWQAHHRGLRYPVEMILDLLSAGMSQAQILGDYPDLEVQDITAALEYAAHAKSADRR